VPSVGSGHSSFVSLVQLSAAEPASRSDATLAAPPQMAGSSKYAGGDALGTTASQMASLTSSAAARRKLLANVHRGGTASAPGSGAATPVRGVDAAGSRESTAPEATLCLDVEVSAGSWEVEGQYLRWYLPADAAEAGIDGFGTATGAATARHEIRIKRQGGPVDHSRSASAWDLITTGCGLLG
jgi:hypothetical protein